MTAGLVLTWNGDASSAVAPGLYVQKVRRRMTGAVRDARVPVPGRDGAYLFPERRGARTIVADCLLVSDAVTDRRADHVAVADWLDVRGEARLLVSDQPDRFWLASLLTDPDPDEWRATGRFQVEWEAQSYAFSTTISQQVVTAGPGASGGSGSGSFSAPDELDAYPEITVVPSGGAMTALDWTLNGDRLTWAGSVPSGGALVLSSLSDTITTGTSVDSNLTGAFDPAALDVQDADGTFGLVVPGTNTWAADWAGTATGLTATLRWRRRYR